MVKTRAQFKQAFTRGQGTIKVGVRTVSYSPIEAQSGGYMKGLSVWGRDAGSFSLATLTVNPVMPVAELAFPKFAVPKYTFKSSEPSFSRSENRYGNPKLFPTQPFINGTPNFNPSTYDATISELNKLIDQLSKKPNQKAVINVSTNFAEDVTINGTTMKRLVGQRTATLRQLIRNLGPRVNARIKIENDFGHQRPKPGEQITSDFIMTITAK